MYTIRYEFLRFADMIGAENQALLDEQGLYHALLGEWIFAAEAHGTEPLDLDYVSDVLQARFGRFCSLALLHAAMRAREIAGAFLDACLAAVERDAPAIVGFTSSFQQNCASLALARRIKSSFPETVIVFSAAPIAAGRWALPCWRPTLSSTRSASTRAIVPFPPMSAASPPVRPPLLFPALPNARMPGPRPMRTRPR